MWEEGAEVDNRDADDASMFDPEGRLAGKNKFCC